MAIILRFKIKDKRGGWNKGESKSALGRVHDVIDRKCETCGKPFKTKVKNVLRDGGKYCNIRCSPNKLRFTPEQKVLVVRERNLKKNYELSLAEYEEMLHAQNGVCAICKKPASGKKHHGLLFVDHDHDSGAIRGLLCGACNTALGLFKDNPDVLISAANYLTQNRSK